MRAWTGMESGLGVVVGPAVRRRGPRRSFTLIEVLLVLAMMVIISSVTWISLKGPMARQRVHSAADAVRGDWSLARRDAEASGQTYVFRYLVHGDRYRLGPQEDPSLTESPAGPTPGSAAPVGAGAGQRSSGVPSSAEEDELSDDSLPPPRPTRPCPRGSVS